MRHDFYEERKEALQKWADLLDQLERGDLGDNVERGYLKTSEKIVTAKDLPEDDCFGTYTVGKVQR
jgi:hypothetical protein